MKARTLRLLLLLALAVLALLPTTAAFADDGDDGNYKFYGTVVDFPSGFVGDWLVNDGAVDRIVHVSAVTRINTEHGPIAQGVCVEVKGWLQSDNSVNATKIETKEPWKCSGSGGGGGGGSYNYIQFYGLIQGLPNTPGWIGDWTVSDRTVHVTQATRIEQHHGPIAQGACVEVKGFLQADSSVDATKIETKEPWKCPGSGGGGGGGSTGYTEFYGTVESLPANGLMGDWVVSGRTVHVDASTRIEQEHGPVAVGAYVEVKGWVQTDGSVNATKIEVKMSAGGSGGSNYIKFYGTIDSLPAGTWIGDWTVSGRTVHVSASTRIEQEHGAVAVGAYVEVKGWTQADGSVNAVKIEVKASSGTGGGGGSSGTYTKFYGFVEQLPTDSAGNTVLVGTWIVSGRVTSVTATTWIDQEHGPVTLNAYVEVEGLLQSDGSVLATKIEVKASPPTGVQPTPFVKFYGYVEALPSNGFVGNWTVSGRTVVVDASTWINQEHGAVAVNAFVEVEGYLQPNGDINATKIEVKDSPNGSGGGGSTGYVKFYGVVEDLPASGLIGDWLVSGRTVHVNPSTRIEQEHGTVRIGARVEVKGIQQADGTINALKIEVKG